MVPEPAPSQQPDWDRPDWLAVADFYQKEVKPAKDAAKANLDKQTFLQYQMKIFRWSILALSALQRYERDLQQHLIAKSIGAENRQQNAEILESQVRIAESEAEHKDLQARLSLLEEGNRVLKTENDDLHRYFAESEEKHAKEIEEKNYRAALAAEGFKKELALRKEEYVAERKQLLGQVAQVTEDFEKRLMDNQHKWAQVIKAKVQAAEQAKAAQLQAMQSELEKANAALKIVQERGAELARLENKLAEDRQKLELDAMKVADLRKVFDALGQDGLAKIRGILQEEAQIAIDGYMMNVAPEMISVGNPDINGALAGGLRPGTSALLIGERFSGREWLVREFVASAVALCDPVLYITTTLNQKEARAGLEELLVKRGITDLSCKDDDGHTKILIKGQEERGGVTIFHSTEWAQVDIFIKEWLSNKSSHNIQQERKYVPRIVIDTYKHPLLGQGMQGTISPDEYINNLKGYVRDSRALMLCVVSPKTYDAATLGSIEEVFDSKIDMSFSVDSKGRESRGRIAVMAGWVKTSAILPYERTDDGKGVVIQKGIGTER